MPGMLLKVRLLAREAGHTATDKISGVYCIRHLETGKVYVGKSSNVFGRWRMHLVGLRAGSHVNPHLQRAWNKYGEGAFTFDLLEIVPDHKNLGIREMWHVAHLEALDDTKGYNLNQVTPDSFRASDETRAKQGAAQKKAWERTKEVRVTAMQSPEYKEKQRDAQLAREYKATSETKAKISAANLGRPQSEAHKAAKAEAHRGWIPSEDTRAKIGAAHRGTKASPETRAKMSATRLGQKRGPYKTQEDPLCQLS